MSHSEPTPANVNFPTSPKKPTHKTCVFLMDPLSSVIPYKDTSIMFMVELLRRGYPIVHVAQGDISRVNNSIQFRATPITTIALDQASPFSISSPIIVHENEVSAVFIRTDPPVDPAYIHDLWMLDLMNPSVYVMNRPHGIRTVNEKLWCTQFRELVPDTLVTRHMDDFLGFLDRHREVILKPINGYGGQGVFKLRHGDSNAKVAFETLSRGVGQLGGGSSLGKGSVDVIVQPFIPAAAIGDKRILLCHGDPIGAILRVHNAADHRNNFFAGGSWAATEITARDRVIIDRIRGDLVRLGLDFVGIDIIGEYLIEVNVTSPTCLQEMNRAYGVQLERTVIDFVETQLK